MNMEKDWKKILTTLVKVSLFVASIALVIVGHGNPGYQGLLMQVIGLVGLVILLAWYNSKYK